MNKDMRRLVGQVIWASLDNGAFASFSEPEPKPKREVLVFVLFLCIYLFCTRKWRKQRANKK